MSIAISNNIFVSAGMPIDAKYLNALNQPYANTGETNTRISQSQRYSGLTVNILGNEYWYKNGVTNSCLIPKLLGGTITGATNGLGHSGANICLGGTLTNDTHIDGNYDLFFGDITPIANMGVTVAGDFLFGNTGNTNIDFYQGNVELIADNNIILKNYVNTAQIHLSGSTIGLTGIIKLLSTPVIGLQTDNALVWDATTSQIKMIISSGITNNGGSGERITKSIFQPAHGFAINDVIGWSSGTYSKAIANGLYNGETLGLVTKVSGNTFDLTQAGYISGLTTLSANTTYFLSDVTAGLLTTIKPTTITHIVRAVLVTTTPNAGWILPYAGYKLASGGGGGGDKNNIYSKTIITSDITLTTGSTFVILVNHYGNITITLPLTPIDGQAFNIKDVSYNASTYNIIIDGNSKNIDDNVATQTLINTDSGALEIMYDITLDRWFTMTFVN